MPYCVWLVRVFVIIKITCGKCDSKLFLNVLGFSVKNFDAIFELLKLREEIESIGLVCSHERRYRSDHAKTFSGAVVSGATEC